MSTLKQLVDETTNIKNELVACHTNLKNNLIAKGITVLPSDKMPGLINKINTITTEKHTYLPEWANFHDMWFTAPDCPLSLKKPAMCVVGSNIYIMEGIGSAGNSDDIACFNTINGTWSQKTKSPTKRYDIAVSSVGTNIYTFGGYNMGIVDTVYCYDTINDKSIAKRVLPKKLYDASASAVGTNIYISGGYNGGQLNSHYCYDTKSDTYTTKANMPFGRQGHCSVTVGTNIYTIGGASVSNIFYDTKSNTWTQKNDVQFTSTYSRSVAYGTTIYMIVAGTTSIMYDTVSGVKSSFDNVKYGTIPSYYGVGIIGRNIYKMCGDAKNLGNINEYYII